MKAARLLVPFQTIWSLAFGPVFQKEVYISGRRTSTYYVRSAVALLLLGVIALTCIPLALESGSNQGVIKLQQSQQMATILTAVVIGFDFGILMLFTPILIVPAVMEEVTKRTLPALLTTPISAAEIIFGKLLGRGLNLIVLALIPMPILLVLRTLGGVPGDIVPATVAMILTGTVLIGSLSILISVWSRKPGAGIVATFIFFVALQAIPPVVLALAWDLKIFQVPEQVIASLSVFSSLFVTLLVKLAGETVPFQTTQLWIINSLYNLAISAVLLLVAISMLRRVMRREGSGESGMSSISVDDTVLVVPPAGLTTAAPGAALSHEPVLHIAHRDQREVGDQPVLWREVRQPVFAKRRHLFIAIAAVIGLLTLIFYMGRHSPVEAMQVALGITLVLALLGSAVLTTGSIGTERDSQTWEVLLTTSLTAHEIVWGKFLGILRRQLIVPALGAVFILLLGVGIFRGVHPAEILLWLCHTCGPLFFLSATGVFFSLLCRKSTSAAVWNLLLAIVLWGVFPAVVGIVCYPIERYFLQQSNFSDAVFSGILLTNPVFCFFATVGGGGIGSNARWSSGTTVSLFGNYDITLLEFVIVSLVICAGYVAAGIAVLRLTKTLFPRLSGRVSADSPPGTPSVVPH